MSRTTLLWRYYAKVIVFFNQPAFSCQVIHVTFRSQGRFDHNLKNATVKEYLCGMREVYNENKPIVLAENSNETDLSFKSAVMKKENPSITMYLGVDNCLDICKILDFMRPQYALRNIVIAPT